MDETNLTTSFPKREGKRDEKGSGFRVAGEVQSLSPFHRRFSSPRRTDSTVGGEVALSAMLVCHGPPWTDDDTLLQSANNCQLRASPFRVGSSPQYALPTPNFQHGARPRSSSPIIGEIAHVQNHAWGRRFPPFGSFCHPLGEAFLALWGWGSPLVRFPPSPPTPFGARTGRRRCKPPASPHFGGFAVDKTCGGFVPSPCLFLDAFKTAGQPIESPHPRNPPS